MLGSAGFNLVLTSLYPLEASIAGFFYRVERSNRVCAWFSVDSASLARRSDWNRLGWNEPGTGFVEVGRYVFCFCFSFVGRFVVVVERSGNVA